MGKFENLFLIFFLARYHHYIIIANKWPQRPFRNFIFVIMMTNEQQKKERERRVSSVAGKTRRRKDLGCTIRDKYCQEIILVQM